MSLKRKLRRAQLIEIRQRANAERAAKNRAARAARLERRAAKKAAAAN